MLIKLYFYRKSYIYLDLQTYWQEVVHIILQKFYNIRMYSSNHFCF